MPGVEVAPSILSSDFSRLELEINQVQDLAESIHVDVMDGHFVPNISIGPVVSNSLKRSDALSVPLSIHLMISDPWKYGPKFLADPEDKIIFHSETTDRPRELINRLRESGCQVGVSQKPESSPEEIFPLLPMVDEVLVMGVNPGFGGQDFQPQAVERIKMISEKISEVDSDVKIAVDGGMNPETAGDVADAGADIIVAGSAVFGKDDRRAAIKNILAAAEAR